VNFSVHLLDRAEKDQIIRFPLYELWYASNHEDPMLWRVTADIVVAVHAAYVEIIVMGFAAILIGSAAQWQSLPHVRHARALDHRVHPGARPRISSPDAAIT
jgi:hypothetical protein